MKKTIFILLLIGTWVTCIAQKPLMAFDFQRNVVPVQVQGTTIIFRGKTVKTQIRSEYHRGQKTTFYGVMKGRDFCPVLIVAEKEMPTIGNYWAFK